MVPDFSLTSAKKDFMHVLQNGLWRAEDKESHTLNLALAKAKAWHLCKLGKSKRVCVSLRTCDGQ
jgi:hypothetical protein